MVFIENFKAQVLKLYLKKFFITKLVKKYKKYFTTLLPKLI